MKSKNISADIRAKSIKDAQEEIKDIIKKLENEETNLKNSVNQYNRMIQLNQHIQDQFKKTSKEINKSILYKKKVSSKKRK